MSDDDGSTIITIKKPTRYTPVDYRGKLALCAQDLADLRILSCNIYDNEEFHDYITALIAIMTVLNRHNTDMDDDMSIDISYVHDHNMFEDVGSTSDSSTETSQSSKSTVSSTTNSSLDSNTSFNMDLSQFDNLPPDIYNLGEVGSYAEIIGAFSLLLGCSMTDLDSIMDAIVNMSTINQREWNSVKLTTTSPQKIAQLMS